MSGNNAGLLGGPGRLPSVLWGRGGLVTGREERHQAQLPSLAVGWWQSSGISCPCYDLPLIRTDPITQGLSPAQPWFLGSSSPLGMGPSPL